MNDEISSRGVHTVEDLRQRCVIDDITGCWRYAMHPRLWMPGIGRRVTLGVAICFLLTGKEPRKGVAWHCTCSTKDCANPRHRRAGNRSSQMKAANLHRDALTVARIARTKRAASDLTEESCAEIRASHDSLAVLAKRYGVSPSHAGYIRAGKRRAPIVSGCSVFCFAGSIGMGAA